MFRLLLAACLAVPMVGCVAVPTADAPEDLLALTALRVFPRVPVATPFKVGLGYEGDPISLTQVCFIVEGRGPYCRSDFVIDRNDRTIRTEMVIRQVGAYPFSAYARYGDDDTTNMVTSHVRTVPS